MKRTAAFIFVIALLLSACIPAFSIPKPAATSPSVDTQATDEALAATLAAGTLNSLPTPTLVPTDTPQPTAIFTQTAPNATVTQTLTPNSNATTTETLTPGLKAIASATFTQTATATGTLPTPTPTETLYARFFGTLPPTIPYGKVNLINRSKAEAYVSLYCTTVDGYTTILEYPVEGRMRISAPAGKYTYVAWVGGRQFQGSFGLGKNNETSITFEKDKVTIK